MYYLITLLNLQVGPCTSRFLIIRCSVAYNVISLAVYGTVLIVDVPRPYPYPHPASFPQAPSVDDMLSGAAWKDIASSSIGGAGPYIPKLLLGRFDSEEERETRRQFYREQKENQRIRNCMAAVKMLNKEGVISDIVANELESKVHDDHGNISCIFFDTVAFMSQVVPILCAALEM